MFFSVVASSIKLALHTALYVHWSDIIQESAQIYEGLSPYTSYSMFFLKIKNRQLLQNSEEYTDFQHLGSSLEPSADQRRYHVVNSKHH